jgi:hypothetical protein
MSRNTQVTQAVKAMITIAVSKDIWQRSSIALHSVIHTEHGTTYQLLVCSIENALDMRRGSMSTELGVPSALLPDIVS